MNLQIIQGVTEKYQIYFPNFNLLLCFPINTIIYCSFVTVSFFFQLRVVDMEIALMLVAAKQHTKIFQAPHLLARWCDYSMLHIFCIIDIFILFVFEMDTVLQCLQTILELCKNTITEKLLLFIK